MLCYGKYSFVPICVLGWKVCSQLTLLSVKKILFELLIEFVDLLVTKLWLRI